MKVTPDQARARKQGGSENFTGDVVQSLLHGAVDPSRVSAGLNTFRAGSRTRWHTHPLGQVLHITQGRGRVQKWGEPVIEVAAGDTVWIAPLEKHWHGAALDGEMMHVSIQEALDGSAVTWLEEVSEPQYRGEA